ncbi:uncharacterized protein LOC126766619, partial [Bactrocera neohumeralis]|uniref:uncharacterized protein LOC126766619 n=1 Tax=Bactrocera neohumeralis TaxID=98809 RepID=UPI0021665B2F
MAISTSCFYGKRYKQLSQALADIADDDETDDVDIVMIPLAGCVEVFNNSIIFDSEDEIPLAQLQRMGAEIRSVSPIWNNEACNLTMDLTTIYIENKMKIKMDLDGRSPVEVFETLFDKDVVQLIIEKTHLKASQENSHKFIFDEDDLKVFLGILFYSGYHSMPRESMYWQLDEDTLSPL